jgi:CRISPR-associated protein Cas5d
MLDDRTVKLKVGGEYACFTRPDLKVERMTYPCMTPSAARGIMESIAWKKDFQWYIRRILILNPIVFVSVMRNEIKCLQRHNPIVVQNEYTPRNSVILKSPSYIIEASVYIDDKVSKIKPEKYIGREGIDADNDGIFVRRLKKGRCWKRPFLGMKEFSAEFSEPDGTEVPINVTLPIGSMIFDIFYDNGIPKPLYAYDMVIRNGVLDCNIPENMEMRKSSHIKPSIPYGNLFLEESEND